MGFGPGFAYGNFGTVDAPPDPMTQPLPVAPPPTWKGREDRVRWCNDNLTPGELALLIKLRYEARGSEQIRRADCDGLIAKERKALG